MENDKASEESYWGDDLERLSTGIYKGSFWLTFDLILPSRQVITTIETSEFESPKMMCFIDNAHS